MPEFLYKFYRPSSNSIVNLENNLLHLSSPEEFNDPFDSYVCIEEDKFAKYRLLKTLKEKKHISKDETPDTLSEKEYWEIFYSTTSDNYNYKRKNFNSLIWEIMDKKSKEFKEVITSIQVDGWRERKEKIKYLRKSCYKITCFSNFSDDRELGINTTMWSHYADNHKGFCVKYSLKLNELKHKDLILCGLYPVIYTARIPTISPRELMKSKFLNEKLQINKHIQKTILKSLITKSRFWNYEKEWRLIISNQDDYVFSDGTIPFVKPESIYMGCRIENNLKKHLVKYAEEKNIDIYQAYQLDEKFELSFCKVTTNSIKQDEYDEKTRKYYRKENEKEKWYLIRKLQEFEKE
ncbi:MAG TPA: DUF2971 domain-containing protein [bacterium]|nr:DUF2971 domain-containing protein [bacterium]